jgi:hypothetical protein
MHSTPNSKQGDDPHDILVVAPDVARVVPAEDQISELLHEAAARYRSDSQPHAGADFPAGPTVRPVDTTFRPAAVNDVVVPGKRGSMVRRAVRTCIALLLAACIGVAAVAWRSYGDTARKQIVKLTTQFALISWPPPEKPGFAAQPAAPAVQADTANAAPPQPAAPAQSAAEAVPATAAAPSPDSAKLLQSMTHDLASLGQEVEQLKASIEQLKASQQQMSRDVAKASEVKASEQNLRPRISALPPRPAATRARKPLPSYPSQQALTAPVLPEAAAPYVARQPEPQPQAPVQSLTDPELSSVPRPPMPVR